MKLDEGTAQEINDMLAGGMTQMHKDDFLNELDRLGYKLLLANCFNYNNYHNKNKYYARALYYVGKETGMSFAHVDGRRDERFKKLQEIRYHCFVVDKGRICEL